MPEKVRPIEFRKTGFRKGQSDPTDSAIGFAVCLIGSLIVAGILYVGMYGLVSVAVQMGLSVNGY